jgi:glycosyltransferase involved in cell wall biosynthesis
MLVVHIITGLGIGGAESMLLQLLRISAHGPAKHLVLMLSPEDALRDQVEATGVPVINLSEGGKNIFGSLLRARLLFKVQCPSLIMTWLHHADLFGVMLKCFFPMLPLIWNIRCSKLEPDYLPRRNLLMVSLLARLSWVPTAIIANSSAGMQAHIAAGYKPEGWRVLPNGFDIERFCPNEKEGQRLRIEIGIDRNAFIIGLVARFHPMKGFDLFVRAAERIAVASPHAHFVMVGSEVDWNNRQLSNWIEEAGLRKRFTLLGSRLDIPQVMNMLDILVSSSTSEGFPNVIGEAMACGTLCVATDVGDSAYLVGETGKIVLFDSDSDRALADAILEFDVMPKAQFNRMREAARCRILEQFSINEISMRYHEVFNEFKK